MTPTKQDFWDAFERLSEGGHCDSPGGMEYNRILEEWNSLGRPSGIEQFIRVRANILPDGNTPHSGLN